VLGGQGGYFTVVSGPGTLTRAAFLEGRIKFALDDTFGNPGLGGLSLGGRVGYASGSLGNTSIGASTFNWGVTLSYQPMTRPLSVFVDYDGFSNRTASLGQIWTENRFKVGAKLNIDATTSAPPNKLEPMVPLPTVLGYVTKF
jgi:hypothetical protein